MAIISFEASTHSYQDQHGQKYISVSKFLEQFKQKFDRETMLKFSAAKKGVSVSELDAEWKATNLHSTDHGTRIHENIEHYLANGISREDDLQDLCTGIYSTYFKDYHKNESEARLHIEEYKVAGTCDMICYESKRSMIIDIYDFKTNVKKGVVFSDKYNKFMNAPVSHLVDVNYSHYSLQLSLYAYMKEVEGFKPRRLGIIYIPYNDGNIKNHILYPVPYLRTEIIAMLEHYKNNLPQTKLIVGGVEYDLTDVPSLADGPAF